MNFFQPTCQEDPRTDALFGLCDKQDGSKAYTDSLNPNDWIATVKNDSGIELTFTAIDKCVIKDGEEPGRGRCDGMLTSDRHLYFVELKEQTKNWKVKSIAQLESTIQFFKAHHNVSAYKFKKAFACNKKHPHFHEIDHEQNLRFFREYGFRIDAQAEIIIV
jgi:hypothetical protein